MIRSIAITGASSGLGAALAKAYAGPGVHLALGGRDRDRLHHIATQCRHSGAMVQTCEQDVTDAAAMADWLGEWNAEYGLDLLIANAGISAGTGGGDEGADQTRRIFATNVDGVLNTVLPAIPLMQSRRSGQIAIMASLAGFRGMPGAPAYCASKAAIRVWGEGLRGSLAPQGIRVSVICPGFVRTPMTDVNRFTMPFLMDADPAARLIRRKLTANQGRISFPWPMAALSWLAASLPDALMDRLSRTMPGK